MLLQRMISVLVILIVLIAPLSAEEYLPTIDYANVLDTYFDDKNGLISFQDARVIFAPEGKFDGKVAVLDADNKIIAHFSYYEDYRGREGVYAVAPVKAPADVTLTKPGVYTIAYVIDNKPATRMPVRLLQTSAGDDPFDPQKKFNFDGYWRTFAFITMNNEWKGEKFPDIHAWVGGMDLPAGKRRDALIFSLFRGSELVAHSKRGVGVVQPGHFRRVRSQLYHPHPENKSANAEPFVLKDWLVDGIYELRVNRVSDKAALRSYDFRVANGKIEHHPRSKPGYQPQVDYIAPRVQKPGATSLELTEAFWIEDRKIQ